MGDLTAASLQKVVEEILSGIANRRNKYNLSISEKQLIKLCNQFTNECEKESILLKLNGTFTIVGDIHGNIESLIRIFNQFDYPPHTSYLFLGDYVDRGENSLEVIVLLFTLKLLYPNNIYLLRGNHECESMTSINGFKKECLKKSSLNVYQAIIKSFDFLSIAANLNNKIFCVHGGISPLLKTLNDLNTFKKPICEPFNDLINDLLWSDPNDEIDEFAESYRTIGKLYGFKATSDFLDNVGLILLVRSHEMCDYGYDYPFAEKGKALTIFSSVDYCGNENSGSVAISDDRGLQIVELEPLSDEEKQKMRILFPAFIISTTSAKMPIESLSDEFTDVTEIPALVG
ncbi:Serine/threonine-protein phosphatase PP1-gamma catalytic subunit [Tritrichomonas foetus]|uniref:Serine/threonine-protein phosphatase n=1 Tax=Tritrichomonas foetus TaxID=1144522 RepID=A0A1J4KRZ2_9EUKA|nr:Serine/threonine-protein phosphatase PP1-gamma catalytic subunit [Tritrichomonas foetus]|eukprot:OHT12588.1 Serine/threonine-protein phosphatase PP1-gamma catalytic subunit [Tritrichomonas foetus]